MAFNPNSSLGRLFNAPIRQGVVVWLGVRPVRREPMEIAEAIDLLEGRGITGDRYSKLNGARQVTLIQAESVTSIASHIRRSDIAFEDLRRNIVTSGINLLALKDRRFRIGGAILETSGECHPCSRMEEILGDGGYNAMRGLGGLTARVIAGGQVRIGDGIDRLDYSEPAAS